MKIITVKMAAFLSPDNADKGEMLQPVPYLSVSERNSLILKYTSYLVSLQTLGWHSPEYLDQLEINLIKENLHCYRQDRFRRISDLDFTSPHISSFHS